MKTEEKKEISDHLIEAMERENMHTCHVAEFLNIKSCYVSMIKNERSWDSMSAKAWSRFEQWHVSRGKISEFVIPEGEEKVDIKKPALKESKSKKVLSTGESPYKVIDEANNRSLKVMSSDSVQEKKEEKQIIPDEKKVKEKAKLTFRVSGTKLKETLRAEKKEIERFKPDTKKELADLIQKMRDLIQQLSEVYSKARNPEPETNTRPGIVIFQRNIYKS